MRRPILDSGSAYKIVYLSKAPAHLTNEQLEKAINSHVRTFRKELQAQGKLVKKINRSLYGIMGDVRLEALWEVLGVKRTKAFRRAQVNAGLSSTESASPDGHHPSHEEGGKAPSPV